MTFARLAELIDPDVTRNVPVAQIAGLLDADLGRMVDREACGEGAVMDERKAVRVEA